MRKRRYVLLCILVFFQLASSAQLLKGRVLGEEGKMAAGVTVSFKHAENAIITRADGSFQIMATRLPDTLVFSAVGFESYKVVITEKNIKDPSFEVVLLRARSALSEVVVTGYGSSRKRDVSGASETYGLSGKVAGVSVAPGTSGYAPVRVRGASSKRAPSTSTYVIPHHPSTTAYEKDIVIDSVTRSLVGSSRLLTAGEVNDFRKWKMWEDYTTKDFKSAANMWEINPVNRYSVQLTGKNRSALINEPVYLIEKRTKDTAWKAFTDNTGKAELWSEFFMEKKRDDGYFIVDRYGNKADHLSMFNNGVNLLQTQRDCQLNDAAEIAFVVDATGSMADEIEFLKLELEDVLRKTMDKYRSLSLKAASVFYRDKGDEYVTRNVAFNEDLLKTINFIKLQRADGGGDTPEAVEDALEAALNLQWSATARAKLLFIVLDAPPHQHAKEKMKTLIVKAAAMGVRIIPIACSGVDKETEFLLRSMALGTNGTYTFLTDHSGVGNPHIEPTTDKYDVELLNNLLQRIIEQYLYAKECDPSAPMAAVDMGPLPKNILSVKIYPNPTQGRFTIESTAGIKEIFITDFAGKILMRILDGEKAGNRSVDIGNYPAGTYLVRYLTVDNKWGVEKVVVVP
ncbi:MAG: carboxypeptidase-like regulatory domain-containing protein [Chitinophagaceae bacterium]|nr:carboxypeptidase-like regulatory domain-containing protein [Chitinophagaceae bacterium]